MALERLFLEICNMSFIASYIILAVIFVRLLLKKAPKIFSYSLWAVVLFRLLTNFSFKSFFSIFSIAGQTVDNLKPFPAEFAKLPETTTVTQYPNSTIVTTALERPPFEIIYPTIWLIGIAIMLVYSMISLLKLRRKLIGATPLEKNIYIADHIDSPFVMGLIRPKIYLPSNLTDSEREFIIKHEQTHIKRLDHITRILSFIALAVHWFNPLVWIAFVLSGKDMEISCDEAVMKKMNTDIRAEYAESLLKFATGRKLIHATPLAFGEGDTKERVKNVMKYKKPVVWVSAICLVLVGVVAVSLMSNGKNDEQDLSLLNPKMLTSVAHQMEDYVQVIFEDGTETQVFPKKIANFLNDNNFKRKNMDPIELIASYQFDVGGTTVSLYEFEPNLIKFHNEHDYRYYTKSNIYNEFLSILNSDITEFEAIEIGIAKETIREQFGEPDTYGNWGYDEIYLLEDAQITISYDSDSETNSFVEEVNINTHARLSLNDIIILSQKGEDLTWADFEKFPYIESGSGLYIRIYEINDLFRFSIGGGATEDKPIYMKLSAKIENEPFIDIRTENVTEFISKYGKYQTQTNDRLPLPFVTIQADDNLHEPRYYENGFKFTYDELPIISIAKETTELPISYADEFDDTAYWGIDTYYDDGRIVRESFEVEIDSNKINKLYITDGRSDVAPNLDFNADSAICWVKANEKEEAEYVFKVIFE